MEVRAILPADLNSLIEIDGTIESSHYIHIDRIGEGLETQWRIEERRLRQTLIERNRPSDEVQFLLKQLVTGADEGIALLAEHEGAMIAMLLAQRDHQFGVMRVADLRVDSDYRRQGLASAMLFQVIAEARRLELRAVAAETRSDNVPANRLFAKLGMELAGLDTHRNSNHDLVKESATLFWYMALD